MTSDHELFTCARTGKILFPNRRAALDELATITTRAMYGDRRRPHLETGAFRCRWCGGWHLTSAPWNDRIVAR